MGASNTSELLVSAISQLVGGLAAVPILKTVLKQDLSELSPTTNSENIYLLCLSETVLGVYIIGSMVLSNTQIHKSVMSVLDSTFFVLCSYVSCTHSGICTERVKMSLFV